MVAPPTPPEPPGVGVGEGVGRLLDEAEEILNAAGPAILAEVEAEQASRRPDGTSWWRRAFSRIKNRRHR
ncbi:hypothetical protein BH24ACT1_BH24ACT1_11730 [soil metagenome]